MTGYTLFKQGFLATVDLEPQILKLESPEDEHSWIDDDDWDQWDGGLPAGGFLEDPFDIVLRHVRRASRRDRRSQSGIGVGVGANLRRHRQFAYQAGKDLGAFFVLRTLAVHDVLEL